jgi:hypothetical protein
MLRARRRPRRLSIFTVQAINQSFRLANLGGEVDTSSDTGLGLRLARGNLTWAFSREPCGEMI